MKAKDRNRLIQYCFGNEIEWLQQHAQTLDEGSLVVVLGAGPGIMSLALFEGNPALNIIAVDHNMSTLHTYDIHLREEGYLPKYHFGDTGVIAHLYEDESIDFLIIDADHTYEGVMLDIRNWWDKVKSGGLVFFHDWVDVEQNGTNGVEKAILDSMKYMGKPEIVDNPGISIVLKRG